MRRCVQDLGVSRVNSLSTARRAAYDSGALLCECFSMLGSWTVSCHAKDTLMLPTN